MDSDIQRILKDRGRSLIRPIKDNPGLVHFPKWLVAASEKEKKAKEGEGLENRSFYRRQRRIFEELARDPVLTLTELYGRCGLASKEGGQIKGYLVRHGLAVVQEINTGRRGNKIKCLELTGKGIKKAESLGIEYRGLSGKGSFAHRFWQHRVKGYFEGKGYIARLEGEHPGVDDLADVSLEKDGERIAVEVELSGKHMLENLKRDFENEYDVVIVVVTTSKMEKLVNTKIEEALSLWRERVMVVRAGEFLEKNDRNEDGFEDD